MQDIGCYSLSAGNNRNYKSDAKNWQKSVRFWYQPLLTFTFHILMFSIWIGKFTTKIEKLNYIMIVETKGSSRGATVRHWTGNPGVVSSSLGEGGSFSEERCLFVMMEGVGLSWSVRKWTE